jgi:hypothetical protein
MNHILNSIKIDFWMINETLKLLQSKWDNNLIIPMYIINTLMDLSIHNIKATVSVCLSVWALSRRFLQSLPVPCGVYLSWQTGQGGQGNRCGGLGEMSFLLKKSLGKTRGPASNHTKVQFFFKIIFIIEHI